MKTITHKEAFEPVILELQGVYVEIVNYETRHISLREPLYKGKINYTDDWGKIGIGDKFFNGNAIYDIQGYRIILTK